MIKIIAHRGFSSRRVENTKAAIDLAFKKKYIDSVEVDVRITKDKKLILIHDKLIKRKKGRKIIISDTNYSDLVSKPIIKKKNLFNKVLYRLKNNKNKKGGYIPLLKDVLKVLPEDKKLLLDLKENSELFIDELAKELNKSNKDILIQSENEETLEKVKNKLPSIKVGLIIKKVKDFNYKYDFYSIGKKAIVKEYVDKLLKQKKEVNIWTINSYADFLITKTTLKNTFSKVSLITDYPDVMNFLTKKL